MIVPYILVYLINKVLWYRLHIDAMIMCLKCLILDVGHLSKKMQKLMEIRITVRQATIVARER